MASVREVGDNKWEIRWNEPSGGKRQQRSKTVEARNRREAERIALQLEGDRRRTDGRTFAEASNLLLQVPRAKATTDGVRRRLRLHVLPVIGHKQLDELTYVEIRSLLLGMHAAGSGYSQIASVWSEISTTLRLAREYGWTTTHISRPDLPKKSQREMQLPTLTKVRQAIVALDATTEWAHVELSLAVRIALATAARCGEISALRWSDIAGSSLRITRAVSMHDNGLEVRETKGRLARAVPVPQSLIERLGTHRANAALRLEREPEDDEWIFHGARPGLDPFDPNCNSARWLRFRRAHGYGWRFHDHRHLVISQWLEAGIPVEQVSRWAGHRRTSMTLDTYGHLITPRSPEGVAVTAALVD